MEGLKGRRVEMKTEGPLNKFQLPHDAVAAYNTGVNSVDIDTDVYVSPAFDAVGALAALGGAANERPVLLFTADQTRLPTDAQVHQAPTHPRELTSDCCPEPNLHLCHICRSVL